MDGRRRKRLRGKRRLEVNIGGQGFKACCNRGAIGTIGAIRGAILRLAPGAAGCRCRPPPRWVQGFLRSTARSTRHDAEIGPERFGIQRRQMTVSVSASSATWSLRGVRLAISHVASALDCGRRASPPTCRGRTTTLNAVLTVQHHLPSSLLDTESASKTAAIDSTER